MVFQSHASKLQTLPKKIEGKYFPLVLEKPESGSNVCEDMYMSCVIIYREQGGCLF